MTCREIVEFLADYVGDELPPEQRASFERHFRACTACVAYLDTYRETIRAGRAALCDAPEAAIPAMPEELIQAIVDAVEPAP